MKLYYAGQPGDGYGWGVCNANLIRELGKLCEVNDGVQMGEFDGPMFMPLADHDFNPTRLQCRGTRNFAYTFFEFPLGPNAAANAAKYDVVFCGSTWCKERMEEAGITNAEVAAKPKGQFDPNHDGKIDVLGNGSGYRVISYYENIGETEPPAAVRVWRVYD